MTKRSRRLKGETKTVKLQKVETLEEYSMDQIESRTPAFLGVLRRFISKKRYTFATILVDHFSRFTYVYLQTSTNTEETLKTKKELFKYILITRSRV